MLSKNTVLIVDDSGINRTLLKRILEGDYQVLQAENGRAALDLLERNSGQITGIVLDLIMPVMDGFAFLEQVQAVEEYRNIPILVATADEGGEAENRCLKLGAWDFVRKPYNPATVRLRLQNIISRSRMYLLEQMRYMAEHDTLTGLYNREKFFQASRQMLDERPGETFAFIRFDIDRFRIINSFFGEEEGNRLLRYISELILKIAGRLSCATYGRMEADVFCFCAHYEETRFLQIAEDVRRKLREFSHQYYAEPNFGVYIIEDPDLDVETMYARAAMASEQCKSEYLKFYAYYNQPLGDALFRTQEIINEMDDALAQRQFVVYLQPKYDLHTDLPYGGEALVRWQHPEKGMISPGEFIPVFEHNGFISKLDFYVWEEVCRLLRKWMDEGRNPAPISVNVSRVNMYSPNLVQTLQDLVEKYQVPPRLLNLELTESAYMDNPESMKKTLENLRRCGFVVMMDDFGSGYSSLNTLKDITVDILKIDMKFLPTGESNGRSERILVSVIRMAGWLGIPVIVEGVETLQQRNFLKSVGCGYVQGYYYARPMPVEEYETLVAQGESVSAPEQDALASGLEQEAVWSTDARMGALAEHIPLPMAICEIINDDVELMRVNRAFLDRFGFKRDVGSLRQICNAEIPREYWGALDLAFREMLETRNTGHCDFVCMDHTDHLAWQRLYLRYICPIENRHLLVAVMTDLTEEKSLEKRLEQIGTSHI